VIAFVSLVPVEVSGLQCQFTVYIDILIPLHLLHVHIFISFTVAGDHTLVLTAST
jgi:hypothetical protein